MRTVIRTTAALQIPKKTARSIGTVAPFPDDMTMWQNLVFRSPFVLFQMSQILMRGRYCAAHCNSNYGRSVDSVDSQKDATASKEGSVNNR